MAGGRPSKYDEKYCDQIVKFFSGPRTERVLKAIITGKNEYSKEEYETVALPLPTFAKFARKIGVNTDTLNEWVKKHKEFSVAHNTCKELQKEFLVDNGLQGLYPPASFIFTAKNITDMRNTDSVELTGKDGGPVRVDGFEFVKNK